MNMGIDQKNETIALQHELERVYQTQAQVEADGETATWIHIAGQDLWYLYSTSLAIESLKKFTDGYAADENGEHDVIVALESSGAYMDTYREYEEEKNT